HLAERLAQQGEAVRCLARRTSDTTLLERAGVEIVVGDLTSPDSLAAATAGCDAVVHCGALVSDWALTSEIEAVNVAGTRSLLHAAADASVRRFVQISTTDVYGPAGSIAVDESRAPGPPRNWYARTKLAAEAEVRRAAADIGLEAVILRPATVYGPRSTEVVGAIASALRSGAMLLIGGGRADAGLVYVENLVDAILLALNAAGARGETFNVTDELGVTWRRFTGDLAAGLGCRRPWLSLPYRPAYAIGWVLEHGYRALRTATGVTLPPLLSRQAVHVLGTDQRFSSRRLREQLGWEPRTGYDAGLGATLDWLRTSAQSPD
ncbi:MAG: NAD-dependent epimerase/dehydratase family protein, partial [Solirubrobacteraceae bacterium]